MVSLILPNNKRNTLRIVFRVSFVRFFEESETSNFAFGIYWPLAERSLCTTPSLTLGSKSTKNIVYKIPQVLLKQISANRHNFRYFQRLHTHHTSFKDAPV